MAYLNCLNPVIKLKRKLKSLICNENYLKREILNLLVFLELCVCEFSVFCLISRALCSCFGTMLRYSLFYGKIEVITGHTQA